MVEPVPEPARPQDPFQAEMAALRLAYGQATPGKVDALGRALEEARRSKAAAVPAALALAHRLAGTAGSYGCPRLGELARQIECALERLPAGPDPAANWGEIDALLEQARREAQAVARTGGASEA